MSLEDELVCSFKLVAIPVKGGVRKLSYGTK